MQTRSEKAYIVCIQYIQTIYTLNLPNDVCSPNVTLQSVGSMATNTIIVNKQSEK